MDSTCLESPLKRMNLDTPQRQQEVPQEEVTPSKRRSMDTTHLASPLKRMNLDEGDLNSEANIFKIPQNTPTPSRRGIKSLTMDELIEYQIKCTQNVIITRGESDVENSQHNFNGPWSYKSSSKTWIYYNIVQTPDTVSKNILLRDLRKRGFPNKSATYKWYSWLRLKEFAKQLKMHIQEVLSVKDTFICLLYTSPSPRDS